MAFDIPTYSVSQVLDVLPTHAISAPMREFLIWVARCPRSYDDTMDAWQSHCPRFMVWEDALAAEFVEIVDRPGRAVGSARVRLTQLGHTAFNPRSHEI